MSEPRYLEGDPFALDEDEVCDECGEECDCDEADPDGWHDAQFED